MEGLVDSIHAPLSGLLYKEEGCYIFSAPLIDPDTKMNYFTWYNKYKYCMFTGEL